MRALELLVPIPAILAGIVVIVAKGGKALWVAILLWVVAIVCLILVGTNHTPKKNPQPTQTTENPV